MNTAKAYHYRAFSDIELQFGFEDFLIRDSAIVKTIKELEYFIRDELFFEVIGIFVFALVIVFLSFCP